MRTCTGIAAPPETQTRKVRVASAAASSATLSSAEYIVGTPSNTVTASRSITSSALRGSNRGISVNVAPDSTAPLRPQVRPKT